jgi:branched-chain amino acid transport system ATP-binding protein
MPTWAADPAMTQPLLTIEGMAAGYGRTEILRGVDLHVAEGSITCLIGPNGAGKSTVLKTVSGLLRPSRGTITLRDKQIGGLSPQAILGLGVVHVPQERSLFPAMSVWDNLLMGGFIVRDWALLVQRAEEVAERFPLVASRRHAHAGSLSGGEQKIVEIARALMLDPELLLMDEPSTGLEPRARHVVFETIGELNRAGRTVLLVEQNARSGLAIAHHGAVMEGGVIRLEGSGSDLLHDPEVARLYLGTAGATAAGG